MRLGRSSPGWDRFAGKPLRQSLSENEAAALWWSQFDYAFQRVLRAEYPDDAERNLVGRYLDILVAGYEDALRTAGLRDSAYMRGFLVRAAQASGPLWGPVAKRVIPADELHKLQGLASQERCWRMLRVYYNEVKRRRDPVGSLRSVARP